METIVYCTLLLAVLAHFNFIREWFYILYTIINKYTFPNTTINCYQRLLKTINNITNVHC